MVFKYVCLNPHAMNIKFQIQYFKQANQLRAHRLGGVW